MASAHSQAVDANGHSTIPPITADTNIQQTDPNSIDPVAYSFGPASNQCEQGEGGDDDDVVATSENHPLITAEHDPARFGINVQPTTTVRQAIMHNNDGVFSNMSAKPEVEQVKEEHPPTYDEASTDNAPPYWDQTMYSPGGADDVYVDGLAVGHVFGFIWNMVVSMSFQFVGFLLTYILHTTHASKQGSRAGLGITLMQYGFYLRTSDTTTLPGSAGEFPEENHSKGTVRDMLGSHIDYAAYALMLVGWFLLIKSTADFLKVRKLESAVRETNSPAGQAVVAHDETPDTAV